MVKYLKEDIFCIKVGNNHYYTVLYRNFLGAATAEYNFLVGRLSLERRLRLMIQFFAVNSLIELRTCMVSLSPLEWRNGWREQCRQTQLEKEGIKGRFRCSFCSRDAGKCNNPVDLRRHILRAHKGVLAGFDPFELTTFREDSKRKTATSRKQK